MKKTATQFNIILIFSIIVFILFSGFLYVSKKPSQPTSVISETTTSYIDNTSSPLPTSLPAVENLPSTNEVPTPQNITTTTLDQSRETIQSFIDTQKNLQVKPAIGSFSWNIQEQSGDISSIPVKGFTIKYTVDEAVDRTATTKPGNYLTSLGFELDQFNVADGTIAGLEGYKKGNEVCIIDKQTVGSVDSGKTSVAFSCGAL